MGVVPILFLGEEYAKRSFYGLSHAANRKRRN